MTNFLQIIVEQKKREVEALYHLIEQQPTHAIAKILRGEILSDATKSFKHALRKDTLAVIAEIKRKSPSKGNLATISQPIVLAETYKNAGADAISVLTDPLYFAGQPEDLSAVAHHLQKTALPILRKDFIIDKIQIAEAISLGANAVLAIVTLLKKNTTAMINDAKKMGIEVLVETHHLHEIALALDSGAEIIGINNRNLATLQVNKQNAFALKKYIPPHIISVAESGIHSPILAKKYRQAEFDAVLIGEALVTSAAPETFICGCHHE